MSTRVLFAGLGSIGQRHLSVLRDADEDFDVVAYRSSEGEAGTFENVDEYRSLDAALSTEPEIAFITNPTHRHVDTARSCAAHGCDLLVEKPLSHTMEGVDELIETVDRQDLVTMMGCQLRFDPVIERVRELLTDGVIGEPYSFDITAGSYLPEWRPGRDYTETYSAKAAMGGGVVLDLIHEIDYAKWLFGELVEIQSHVGQISSLDIETEDIAEVNCRTVNGQIGRIHLDYYRQPGARRLEVVGDRGVVEADIQNGTVCHLGPDTEKTETFEYERNERFRQQLASFLDHVRSRDPCENDVSTGKMVLRTALKIRSEHDD